MAEARMRESDVTNTKVRQVTVGDDIGYMEPELYKLLAGCRKHDTVCQCAAILCVVSSAL